MGLKQHYTTAPLYLHINSLYYIILYYLLLLLFTLLYFTIVFYYSYYYSYGCVGGVCTYAHNAQAQPMQPTKKSVVPGHAVRLEHMF